MQAISSDQQIWGGVTVVSDDPHLHRLIAAILAPEGYAVRAAATRAEALAQAGRSGVVLIGTPGGLEAIAPRGGIQFVPRTAGCDELVAAISRAAPRRVRRRTTRARGRSCARRPSRTGLGAILSVPRAPGA